MVRSYLTEVCPLLVVMETPPPLLVVMETPPPLQKSHLHLRESDEEFSRQRVEHVRDKPVKQESSDSGPL